jgi:O-acetyl-ADP-ribose deacetylase (regulator of RNase III)
MLRYVEGDATAPVGDGHKIIVHICNNAGLWGAGFVLAVSAQWPQPERAYKAWSRDWKQDSIALASVQFVAVECPSDNEPDKPFLFVANIIGQHGIHPIDGVPPVRYDAITLALQSVALHAQRLGASVHMPRIGCGLAGGSWETMGPIIEDTLKDVETYVYDLPRTW